MAFTTDLNTVLFRQKAVEARITQLNNSNAMSMLNNKINSQALKGIEDQIKILNDKEMVLFKYLKIAGDDPEECAQAMEKRIKEASSVTNLPFSGEQLRKTIMVYLYDKVDRAKKLISEKFVKSFLKPNIEILKDVSELLGKFNDIVLGEDVDGRKRTRKLTAFQITDNQLTNFSYSLLSKKQKAMVVDYLKNNEREWYSSYFDLRTKEPTFRSNSSTEDTLSFDIESYTLADIVEQGITQKNYQSLGFTDDDIDKINQSIIRELQGYVKDSVGGNGEEILKQIIEQKILNASSSTDSKYSGKFSFLTGKSLAQITGILGEIQSLFYINYILTGNKSISDKLDWIGGTLLDSKKPHADIILNNAGIQVKNTTKTDIEVSGFSASFKSMKLENFLADLKDKGLNLSNEETDAIYSLYVTNAFNVNYQLSKKKGKNAIYTAASNKIFEPTRRRMVSLLNAMNKILSIYASDLMFFDVAKTAEEQLQSVGKTNLLYIISGDHVTTPSLILSDIYNSLKDKKKQVRLSSVTSFDKASTLTIVDALNQQKANGIKFKDTSKTDMFYDVLNKLTLTSSYQFF